MVDNKTIHITVLENNHVISESTYESIMVYLILRGDELSIEHEVHTLLEDGEYKLKAFIGNQIA